MSARAKYFSDRNCVDIWNCVGALSNCTFADIDATILRVLANRHVSNIHIHIGRDVPCQNTARIGQCSLYAEL